MTCPPDSSHGFFQQGARPFCWKCVKEIEKAVIRL